METKYHEHEIEIEFNFPEGLEIHDKSMTLFFPDEQIAMIRRKLINKKEIEKRDRDTHMVDIAQLVER